MLTMESIERLRERTIRTQCNEERISIGLHNCESGRGRNDAADCVQSPFEPLFVFRGFV